MTPHSNTRRTIGTTAIGDSASSGKQRLIQCVVLALLKLSYLVNVGTAYDVGVTVEDVQGVLIAVAPIVGTPQVVSAAGKIAEALDFPFTPNPQCGAPSAKVALRAVLRQCHGSPVPTRYAADWRLVRQC
jgi:hypothetical protein